jgi:hypothetical protein
MSAYTALFIFVALMFLTSVVGRGMPFVYSRASTHESKIRALIKKEWDCDPFTNCKYDHYGCMLDMCPYGNTDGADCPNQVVGQFSSMCLHVGHNDFKKNIFLGNSYSLFLEREVVAICKIYDVYTHFVSSCELYRLDEVDRSIRSVQKPRNGFPNHRLEYHGTTEDILSKAKQQSALMKKQIAYNGVENSIEPNDLRRIDFPILTQQSSYEVKVSTSSGFSFTLPIGVTEKHTLPVYAELNMDIKVHDDCYEVTEDDTIVTISKSWSCSIRQVFSF